MFARSSFWNSRLPSNTPIDPNSASYIANIVAQGEANTFGLSYETGGATFFFAGKDQPKKKVTIDNTENQFFGEMQGAFAEVPIPDLARPATPISSDSPLCIYQRSTDTYWEFWKASQFEVDGPHTTGQALNASEETRNKPGWHCEAGAVAKEASKNPGYFVDGSWPAVNGKGYHWSSTASGLFLAGGLLKVDEARRLYIPHALQFSIPNARKGVWRWPASKSDGLSEEAWAPHYGMCFRLPPSFDLSTVADPFMRCIARSWKEFGMYLKDKAGNVTIQCEQRSTIPGSQSKGTDAWKGPQGQFGSTGAILSKVVSGAGGLAEQLPWSHLELVAESFRPEGFS